MVDAAPKRRWIGPAGIAKTAESAYLLVAPKIKRQNGGL
jgi:hypothetical protein